MAVGSATSWSGVAEALGLAGGSSTTTVKGHALRLGLDVSHLARSPAAEPVLSQYRPVASNLRRAGSLIAAAWFELCGLSVSWPLEPCRYDLLVWSGDRAERILVKTTTVRSGASWTVWLSTTGGSRTTYDPDEIDAFFVIDGHLGHYLIPSHAVGGLMAIRLSAYERYRLDVLPG